MNTSASGSTRVQILSQGAYDQARIQIMLLQQKRRDQDGVLGEQDAKLLRALLKGTNGFSRLFGIKLKRIKNLSDLPQLILAAMDANSAHSDEANAIPPSYAVTLQEFQELMESYGFRIEGIQLSFRSHRIDRLGALVRWWSRSSAQQDDLPNLHGASLE